MLRPPRLVFAELKGEKGALRPEQRVWLEQLSSLQTLYEGDWMRGPDMTKPCGGVETYLWRPADWATGAVEAILR